MTDWIEHNGGPQPVDDETWIVVPTPDMWVPEVRRAKSVSWEYATGRYRILNQHLIDAARLEGIRLGLEAAAKVADLYSNKKVVSHIRWLQPDIIAAIQKPDTIAKEADNDPR